MSGAASKETEKLANGGRLILLSDTLLDEQDTADALIKYGAIKDIRLTSDLRAAFVDFECEHAPLLFARCYSFRGTNQSIPMPRGVATIMPACSYDNYLYLQVPPALTTSTIRRFFWVWSGGEEVTVFRPGIVSNYLVVVISKAASLSTQKNEGGDQSMAFSVFEHGKLHHFHAIPHMPQLADDSKIFHGDGCSKCRVAALRQIVQGGEGSTERDVFPFPPTMNDVVASSGAPFSPPPPTEQVAAAAQAAAVPAKPSLQSLKEQLLHSDRGGGITQLKPSPQITTLRPPGAVVNPHQLRTEIDKKLKLYDDTVKWIPDKPNPPPRIQEVKPSVRSAQVASTPTPALPSVRPTAAPPNPLTWSVLDGYRAVHCRPADPSVAALVEETRRLRMQQEMHDRDFKFTHNPPSNGQRPQQSSGGDDGRAEHRDSGENVAAVSTFERVTRTHQSQLDESIPPDPAAISKLAPEVPEEETTSSRDERALVAAVALLSPLKGDDDDKEDSEEDDQPRPWLDQRGQYQPNSIYAGTETPTEDDLAFGEGGEAGEGGEEQREEPSAPPQQWQQQRAGGGPSQNPKEGWPGPVGTINGGASGDRGPLVGLPSPQAVLAAVAHQEEKAVHLAVRSTSSVVEEKKDDNNNNNKSAGDQWPRKVVKTVAPSDPSTITTRSSGIWGLPVEQWDQAEVKRENTTVLLEQKRHIPVPDYNAKVWVRKPPTFGKFKTTVSSSTNV